MKWLKGLIALSLLASFSVVSISIFPDIQLGASFEGSLIKITLFEKIPDILTELFISKEKEEPIKEIEEDKPAEKNTEDDAQPAPVQEVVTKTYVQYIAVPTATAEQNNENTQSAPVNEIKEEKKPPSMEGYRTPTEHPWYYN